LSILLVILVIPLSAVVTVALAILSVFRDSFRVLIIAIDGEFGHFVHVMERLRTGTDSRPEVDVILVISRYRFKGLASLYSSAFGAPLVWSIGWGLILQQFALLQPRWLLFCDREVYDGSVSWMHAPRLALSVPRRLAEYRTALLQMIDCADSDYVALAVYTMQYELDRAPKQFVKQRSCESLGVELAPAIDHLLEQQLKVIRIGSADTGLSRIPRNLPRLEDFDVLGGDAEVALVSGCHYVWTDGVGAGALAIPFSNRRSLLIRRDMCFQSRVKFSAISPRIRMRTDTRFLFVNCCLCKFESAEPLTRKLRLGASTS